MKPVSIRRILVRAWIFPAILATIAVIAATVGMAWIEYRNSRAHLESDLIEKSQIIARRLLGEVLLKDKGSPELVAQSLTVDLDLAEVFLGNKPENCGESTSDVVVCQHSSNGYAQVSRRLPMLTNPTYATISAKPPTVLELLQWRILVLSAAVIGLLLGLGLYFQNRALRWMVVLPIEDLSESAAAQAQSVPVHWPKELQQLSARLDEAFLKRDEALMGQIAGGVIHDIKTFLQPIWSASLLAAEHPIGERRTKRLEMLQTATQSGLPKILRTLETALDSSRQIKVELNERDLAETIRDSLAALQPMADARRVEIRSSLRTTVISHDSVQLSRAISNLAKNAIEAASEAQSPLVELKISNNPQSGLEIIVSDNGQGLGDLRDGLFRSFRSTKKHGTGLGLVVSKKIIEAHRATLSATESESLGGAEFRITFRGVNS